jgi:hypothetical protein
MLGTARRFVTFAVVAILASFTSAPGSSYAASTDATALACVDEQTSHSAFSTQALPETAKGKGGPKFKRTIPVYFHVVSPDGVIANVTQAQIDAQINVMNLGFRGRLGGADSGASSSRGSPAR